MNFFNRDAEKDQVMNLKWEEIGRTGKLNVRDLWRQKNLGEVKDEISVNVGPDGCAFFRIY